MDKRMRGLSKRTGRHRGFSGPCSGGASPIQYHRCLATILIALACGCAGPDSSDRNTNNMSDETPLPLNIKLRIGHKVLDSATWRSELSNAMEEANRKVRIANLPDHLNADVIDREKASAFVAGLQKLPAETLKPLAGKTVFLNYHELML